MISIVGKLNRCSIKIFSQKNLLDSQLNLSQLDSLSACKSEMDHWKNKHVEKENLGGATQQIEELLFFRYFEFCL